MAELPLETELLRAGLARRATAAPAADLAPLLARVDWDRLLWLGHRHRVLVAWHHALRPSEVAHIPPEIGAQFQALAEVNQLQILARARECCRLQDLFAQHDLDVLSLSGWALAQRHHAQPLHREIESATACCVRAADRARAETLIASAGYDRPDRLRLQRRHHSDVWLLPPFLAAGAAGETEALQVWPRSEIWEFGGRKFRLLHPNDWLLRLCARGHDHLWQQLCRTVDLAEFLRTQPAFDWPALAAQARSLGLQRALLLGVGTVAATLSFPLPEPLRALLIVEPEIASAIATLTERLRAGTIDSLAERETRVLRSVMGLESDGASTAGSAAPDGAASLGRYFPTPEPLASRLLELAGVGPADVVYDLGCGDGRLVLAAAKRFGARGVGVDLEPQLIASARARAAAEGVPADRVHFICGDLRDAHLAEATVVCLYLQDFAYDLLRPKLERSLRPGTRIVSHRFTFADWAPEKSLLVRTGPDAISPLHLWRIGAATSAAPASPTQQ